MVRGAPRANVLVVVLDSARAKSMPTGDALSPLAPTIAGLARAGCEFPRAVAPGNWTVPSHMSLFTGVYPWTHGRRTFEVRPVREPTIASWLAPRGYESAMFSEEVHLVAGYGLEVGYRHRFCPVPAMSDRDRTLTNRLFGGARWLFSPPVRRMMRTLPMTALPLTYPNFRAEVAFKREVCNDLTVQDFDQWLGSRDAGTPFHALVNFVDPHEPYYPVPVDGARSPLLRAYAAVPRYYLLSIPELRERAPWPAIRAWYQQTILDSDRKVAGLLAALARHGVDERTWVVVTSDHGQSFGEGGNVYHGCGATDSVARIPLVVRPPAGVSVPRRVDRWTSLCEVPSWIKGISLGSPPFDETGFPTVPFPAQPPSNSIIFCEGGPASDPNASLTGVETGYRWNHRLIAAYTDQGKYILDTTLADVRFWAPGVDPDAAPPASLDGADRLRALEQVFGISSEREIRERAGDVAAAVRPPLEDARMRSWGYD
ncbi:MAG TPA: sulfatase-like hydrolase/transferase [Thermoplasmata archaeon]|nr:sulfatase-like hydrolase/transferase [Thermoplasmata archaeon]